MVLLSGPTHVSATRQTMLSLCGVLHMRDCASICVCGEEGGQMAVYHYVVCRTVCLIPYVAKCSRSIIFANFANEAHSRILLFANFYVRTYTVYSYICVRTIITTWCHIKMADVDGSSLFGEAFLWTKFNGIIERFSRSYITMRRYLHIIQCKTIELSIHLKMGTVRRSFAVVIAFPS